MEHTIHLSPPAELVVSTTGSVHRSAPAILQRRDPDFIAAVLEALRDKAGRVRLSGSLARARTREGVLKLFQPVQREYHLAIFEVYCDLPGRPRLDPGRVAAAGLVVRRLRRDSASGARYYEGWMSVAGQLRGWLPVDRLGDAEADPISRLRRARRLTGVANLDRALAALNASLESGLLEEQVVPMFPAPPEVCQSAGRTFFYGLIPTTSSETAENGAGLPGAPGPSDQPFGADTKAFLDHLSKGLQGEKMSLPLAGETMDASWYDAVQMPSAEPPNDLSSENKANWKVLQGTDNSAADNATGGMREFIAFLRQLTIEFDAFGDKPESKAIRDVLAEIEMPLHSSSPNSVRADEFLKQAAALLLENQPGAATPKMPECWPALEEGIKKRLHNALWASLLARFSEVTGLPGRYDEPGAEYAIRAFVREKPNGGCPGRIHWSDCSETFVIAPWYEGDGAPPTQITLPELDKLNAFKPNVSFMVPPALRRLMSGNLKDMLNGKLSPESDGGDGSPSGAGSGTDGGSSIAWICSFNIPVITFCAFLALNLFLGVFSLVIRLALSVTIGLPSLALKLCIPFKK